MDEQLWEDQFNYELEERGVRDDWELYEDEDLDTQERGAQYTQRTFARFKCSQCKRWWNSAEVHVVFFITLNRSLKEGTVKMRIFKQECNKCSFPKLEKPEISHENIMRITKNLVNRILQVFYGEKKAKQDLKPEVYGMDREGPHDKEHCEACKLMICQWSVATKKQPAVKCSSAPKKPKQKPMASSYVVTSTPTYPDYQADFRSTSTFQNYEENKINPKYTSAYSPPRKEEPSTFPVLTSVIAGIGALVLWYLRK